MKWFKFYGQDFQTDPKIGFLTTPQKLMWINLLCIASQDEEHSGIIKFLTENHLKSISGIIDSPSNDDWSQCQNTLDTFEELGLIQRPDEKTIIIPKFKEKQETQLTDAERAKKYRESKKSEAKSDDRHETVTEVSQNSHTRIDKNRLDKNIYNNEPNPIIPSKTESLIKRKKTNQIKEQSDVDARKILLHKQIAGIQARGGYSTLPVLLFMAFTSLMFMLPKPHVLSYQSPKLEVSHADGRPQTKNQQSFEGLHITPSPEPVRMRAVYLPSQEEIVEKIKAVFGIDADMAVAIGRCESGLRADAIGHNANSIDQGIFQINSVHAAKYAGEDIFNPDVNIRVAYQIFKASGWGAWTTYHNNCYQSFLVSN
jgi:lysozyme-like protein/replisome organiser protein